MIRREPSDSNPFVQSGQVPLTSCQTGLIASLVIRALYRMNASRAMRKNNRSIDVPVCLAFIYSAPTEVTDVIDPRPDLPGKNFISTLAVLLFQQLPL